MRRGQLMPTEMFSVVWIVPSWCFVTTETVRLFKTANMQQRNSCR